MLILNPGANFRNSAQFGTEKEHSQKHFAIHSWHMTRAHCSQPLQETYISWYPSHCLRLMTSVPALVFVLRSFMRPPGMDQTSYLSSRVEIETSRAPRLALCLQSLLRAISLCVSFSSLDLTVLLC